jgi:glycosyltransferase involved in cell wall biosynthesis
MPRLLFIAYYFPPIQTVAAVRAWNIAKCLARLGWQVDVVTVALDCLKNSDARELDEPGLRVLRARHRWRFLSPPYLMTRNTGPSRLLGGLCRRLADRLSIEREVGWYRSAMVLCQGNALSRPDVVMATGGPFLSFEIASRIGAQFHCPIVLDYRDLWTNNPHAKAKGSGRLMRKERELVQKAYALTVVSPGIAEELRGRYPFGKNIRIITNGYDPEEMGVVTPTQFDHSAIVYAGQFYPPLRSVLPVFRACARASDQGMRGWRFHYFGRDEKHVLESAESASISDQLVLHGVRPRQECLAATAGAHLSVVIASVAPQASGPEKGIVTGKVFEALGMGTPILLVAPEGGDAEEIVRDRGRRFSGPDTEGMAKFVKQTVMGTKTRYAAATGCAWPNIALKLHELLRSVHAGSR